MEWIWEDLGGGREVTMVKLHVGNSQRIDKKYLLKKYVCIGIDL